MPRRARDHASALHGAADLPTAPAYTLQPTHPMVGSPILLRHPIVQTIPRWYRNVDLFPIDYAFQPRLRGRLTLRRLALRRKPWAFGEEAFHLLYRYSCQHSHFRYLQHASRHTFAGLQNAPLPRIQVCVRSFGKRLEPRYIFGAG